MKDTVKMDISSRVIKFRVIGKFEGKDKLMLSTESYAIAESFCWKSQANPSEMRIEKVWIGQLPTTNEVQG